jgi:hypothetical protein
MEEERVRHLGVGTAEKEVPTGRQRISGAHRGGKTRVKSREKHHIVLEHHDAAGAARAGAPPCLEVLERERGLALHRWRIAAGEISAKRVVVELGRVKIEDELERDAGTAELARGVGDAIREGLDRQHEHGVDLKVAKRRRRRHHPLRAPARNRGRGGATATMLASIGTGPAQIIPSAVIVQRRAIASTPAARARAKATA